jgi:uncharacterized protein YkwD
MGRGLSWILLIFLTLIILSPRIASANQIQNTSFFSIFKQYILSYTENANNNQVLSAKTTVPPSPVIPTPPPQQPVQISAVTAYLINGVNAYRANYGLPPVQASLQTCAFAVVRAQEITQNFNHDGFYDRVDNHTIPYSEWTHATENIAEAPDYHEVVNLWANSPPHAANMRDSTPYVCIVQNGNYFAYEGMRP